MLSIRCSNLGRISQCGQAAVAPAQVLDLSSEDAALGTVADLFFKSLVRGPTLDPDELADLHDVDPVAARRLCGRIWWRWEKQPEPLKARFPDAQIGEHMELAVGDFILTGEMDVSSLVGYELRVLDLKAGFLAAKKSHWPQLFGYGFLGLATTDATSARLSVWNLLDDTVDTKLVSDAELAAWWGELSAFLSSAKAQTYAPDPERCRYCPRLHECDAAHGMVRALTRMLVDLPLGQDPTPDQMAEALTKARALGHYTKQVGEWILPMLTAAGGTMPLSDGRELYTERRETRKITYRHGKEVLGKYIAAEDLEDCLSVTNKIVEAEAKAHVGRGNKGKVVTDLWRELEEVGAVRTSVSEFPDIRAPKRPQFEVTR